MKTKKSSSKTAFSHSSQEQLKKIEKLFKEKDRLFHTKTPAKSTFSPKPTAASPSLKPLDDQQVLYFWKAKEFEKRNRSRRWNIMVFSVLFFLVAYGFFTDNLLMSIVFVIAGLLIYLFENKEPEIFTFGITTEGVFAQNHFYSFSLLESFWIFYHPPLKKELLLKSKKPFLPFIHIPLGDSANPVRIRNLLINFIPEEEQEEGLGEIFEQIMSA